MGAIARFGGAPPPAGGVPSIHRTAQGAPPVMQAARYSLPGALAVLLVLLEPATPAAETLPARLYEVTTETGMPHLEENLRYTTKTEKLCLAHQSLAAAFPILEHPALKGCRLQDEIRQADM